MKTNMLKKFAALLLALMLLPCSALASDLGYVTTGTDIPTNPVIPEVPVKSELVITGQDTVRGGAQVTLTAQVDGEAIASSLVEWAVYPFNADLCTISQGVVTTKKVSTTQSVQVTAALKADHTIFDTFTLTIRPAVEAVIIEADSAYVDLSGSGTLQLSAEVLPELSTSHVKWSSSSPSVASVSQNGLVTGHKIGWVDITVTAQDGTDISDTITLQVVNGVTELAITGPSSMIENSTITLEAVALPSNASVKDVVWSVDSNTDLEVAAISADGRLTAKSTDERVTVLVTAASKQNPSIHAMHQVVIVPAVEKVTVTAPADKIDLGTMPSMQLTAKTYPAEANTGVKWTTSNKDIATVDANGVVLAKKVGKVTITATAKDGSGKSGSVTIEVIHAVTGLTIAGPESVASGKTAAYKATIAPENATYAAVTWSVDCASSIATISRDGRLTVKSGLTEVYDVVVTATSTEHPLVFGSMHVTVRPLANKVTIVAPDDHFFIDFSKEDRTLQLTAVVGPEGADQKVTWSSSKPSVASIDENGLMTAKRIGSTSVTARAADGSGKMTRVTIKVVRAVQGVVIEGPQEVASGNAARMAAYVMPEDASNQAVTWSIDCDKTIASITKDGTVTTKEGLDSRVTVTITATSKEDETLSATHTLTICPKVTELEIMSDTDVIDLAGEAVTAQLTAVCTPSDAIQSVKWTSSKPSVASVDENGLVTAKKVGSTSILAKATDGSGEYARITITVVRLVKKVEVVGSHNLAVGERIDLDAKVTPENATETGVVWSIDCDKEIATIDASGRVTAASDIKEESLPLTVVVTAASKENEEIVATHEVTIRPATTGIKISAPLNIIDINAEEKTLQLTAICAPDDTAQEATWKSSKTSVATVDENGLVTALKEGTVTIKATTTDGTERTASITIKVVKAVRAITISGDTEVEGGDYVRLSATIIPENANNQSITWTVNCDEDIATITTSGRLNTKKVDVPVTVLVMAESKENPAIFAVFAVTILPEDMVE